ncbi:MAG: hypothetical protein FWC20_12665 [Oscillospiraceae bacterium]|nr:hypothetical protein [Oscillospiraceae bacterium]MCL2280238.1 hypothetical protein [Oscillospiraceae bacterium]
MANYDEFKKKAKETLESFADASVDAYKATEQKARVLARKTKLRASIVNDKATIRRLSVEIGTVYYKLFKDNPAPEFERACKEITEAYELIASKEAQIEELKKNSSVKSDCCTPENQDCCDDNNNENP